MPVEDTSTELGDVGTERPSPRDRILVALLTALTAGLGLSTLSASSIWLDEAYTVAVATAPTSEFFSEVLYNGGNMSLYVVLMRFWLMIDESEFWLRLPSVIFATATVPVLYLLARRISGRRVALMSVMLVSTAPPILFYAQEGRAYTLLALLVTASWLALLWHVDGSSPSRWYLLLAVLSVYAHIIGLVFVAAQMLWLGLHTDRRNTLAIAGTVIVLSGPQLAMAAGPQAAHPDWVPDLSMSGIGEAVGFVAGAPAGAAVAAVLAVWAVGAYVAGRDLARGNLTAMAPLLWFLVPVVAIVAVSVVKPLLVPRYLLPTVPAGVLLAAIACAQLRRIGWLAVGALIVLSVPELDSTLSRRNPDWRASSRLIFENTEPGDGIIFASGSRHMAEYYWERQGRPKAPRSIVEPYEWNPVSRRYPIIDWDDADGEAQRLDRIWVLVQSDSGTRPPSADVWTAVRRLTEPRSVSREWDVGPYVRVLLYE